MKTSTTCCSVGSDAQTLSLLFWASLPAHTAEGLTRRLADYALCVCIHMATWRAYPNPLSAIGPGALLPVSIIERGDAQRRRLLGSPRRRMFISDTNRG
jgi:hypothetical protein